MIITAVIEFEKKELCQDYNPAFVSFIKNALVKYDKQLYEDIYENKSQNEKKFCFAVRFDRPKFENGKIELNSEKSNIILSVADMSQGIDFYNAILQQKDKFYPFPNGNGITVQKVSVKNQEAILSNEIQIKMLSPLIVRKHEEKKDYYMSFEHEEFQKYFFKSICVLLKNLYEIELKEDSVYIEPVKAKKTVVTTFQNKITANIGIFILRGDLQILNLLYALGIGSRRSQGFGMFEIISG